jgi:uncharacterized protein YuzE
MKVTIDRSADILSVRVRQDVPTEESEEIEPGVIADYAADGSLVGVEILHVSERMRPPSTLVEALRRIAELEPEGGLASRIAREALKRNRS